MPDKTGSRTAGRRFCAVQAFCRRQNLGAGAIHLPRAFEISQDSIKITTPNGVVIFMEVTPGFEPGNEGFADPCLTTWLCHHIRNRSISAPVLFGAGDEARTRYLHLGKVALYQMSYARESAQQMLRDGASGRNRTNDTRIFSPLLYQLSYRGIWRPRRGSNPRPPA